jgi:hypothetical protein
LHALDDTEHIVGRFTLIGSQYTPDGQGHVDGFANMEVVAIVHTPLGRDATLCKSGTPFFTGNARA